jgi:integrase/recombinase XerC
VDAQESPGNAAQVAAYLTCLATQRHLSANTVTSYARDLAELQAMMATDAATAKSEPPMFVAVSHFQIRRFASQMHARGLNPRSIARKLSAWRGFFDWLSESLPLTANPVDGVKAPKRGKPLPKALSADDAVRLVSADASRFPGADKVTTAAATAIAVAARACNRAMFELLYSSGLRVSELVSLDLKYQQQEGVRSAGWIDFEAQEVTVTGKGNKMRSVPVGQAAITALADWIAARPALAAPEMPALFVGNRGQRMTARAVQLRIKAHAQAVGIPVDVHPHVMRHSFASHLLQSSGDLRAVQEMLGHASITSTQIYTSLDFQRLAQVYDAAHPRARKKT